MKPGFEKRVDAALTSVTNIMKTSGQVAGGKGRPRIGIILGSGLGEFVETIDGIDIPYAEIDEFRVPTVQGHRGQLKLGNQIAVLAGRFHVYEGCDLDDIVLPVFLLARLGVATLVCTNAAGAVNQSFRPGDLALITDHINLLGCNPLVGSNVESAGPRFPDMSVAYSRELRELAQKSAPGTLREGVYAALPGPSYETPAEIRMLRTMGADLVGMSTVPEAIAARFLELDLLGISCVTNMAAGILDKPLDHKEVIAIGRKTAASFAATLSSFLEAFQNGSPG